MAVSRFQFCVALLVAASVELGVSAVAGETPQAGRVRGEADATSSGSEYAPQDSQILSLVRKGAAAKLATRRLKDSPDSPETIRLLSTQERTDEMLGALEILVRNHPARIAEAFDVLRYHMPRMNRDDSRGYVARLAEILAAARKRLPELPREDSARAERVLLEFDGYVSPPTGNRNDRNLKLTTFIQTHPGTEAALLAEVDVLNSGVSLAQLAALESFARAHPGTVAAAKATYLRGFNLAVNVGVTGIERRGSDPTERFMQVIGIARDLENGAYPPCEWVERGPSIVWEFFASNPNYSSENLERVISASYDFVKSHFTLGDNPGESSIGYFVIAKFPALMKARGDEIGGMNDLFVRLERDVSDPSAVRYLKAQYFLRSARETPGERGAFLARAIDALSALQAQGRGLYHRKALATLGALRFAERDFVNARVDLMKYFQAYPDSQWSWIAALRAGLSDQELANHKHAAETYLVVSAKYGANPVARVLAHAYAAHAYEGDGRFDLARSEYQRALAAWDDDYGPTYSLYLTRPPRPSDPFGGTDETQVSKQSLPRRIAQLNASLTRRGGDVVERARWLLERQQRQEAIAVLQPLLTDSPASAVSADARYLVHRAKLEMALDLADADRKPDEVAAIKALDDLGHEPLDFAVTAATVAKASLLWTRQAADAEATMQRALEDWHRQQQMLTPAGPLEQDVAEIRKAVFLPKGGGVYGSSHWNAFDWSITAPPFTIVNPETRVKLANGEIADVSVKQPLNVDSRVLFLDGEQLGLLRATMVRLGGSRRRVPTAVMETPNQPVGVSMDILKLWTKFFPARPGHWGGWELETYPIVTEITFVDAARTRAEAAVTVGYSGCTVILEKERGVWVAKRLTSWWIT